MKLLRNYFIALGGLLLLWVLLLALWVGGILDPSARIYGICFPNREDPNTVYTHPSLTEAWTYALSTAELTQAPEEAKDGAEIRINTLNGRGEVRGEYSLHVISMMNREGILEDLEDGTCYRLSANGLTRLLNNSAFDPEARNLLPNLSLALTAGETGTQVTALPVKESLFFAEGGACGNPEPASQTTPVFEMAEGEGVQISPAVFPDAWTVMAKQGNSILFAQSRITENSLPFMTQAGEYTYEVTAHWDLSPQRDWYGEVTYEIPIRIQPSKEKESPKEGESVDQ